MSRLPSLCMLLLGFVLVPGLVAQSITASLEGIVRDPSGAAVPGARIRVVNTNTNAQSEVSTNADGFFIATLLPPGTYALSVEKDGFKQYRQDSIRLQVTQVAKIDVGLEVGAITESVRVTGEAPLLDSATSSMGQVIDTHEIVNLPLNQRNPFSLIFLAPGVHGSVDIRFNSSDWSANGGRPGSNEILLDGVPASPPVVNPIQGFSIFPSVDAVQEFKFQSNNYSAEFGRSGGSVVNLIYKSGTNQLHGTMFEFLRNSVLDANDFFSNQSGIPLNSYKRNQFGASAGGPVYIPHLYDGHNKTFFFFAYEGVRERSAANPFRTTLPTELQKMGDFSKTLNAAGQQVVIYDPLTTTRQANGTFTRTPFAGNVIMPSRIDPVAKAVSRYYPSPTSAGDPFTQARNFFATSTAPNGINQIDAKVDQNINNNHRFFVRVSRRKLQFGLVDYFPGDSLIAQGGNIQHQDSIGAAVNYTWTVSPTFLMDFRAGFSRMHLQFEPRSLGFNPTDLGLPSYVAGYADVLQFPQFSPSGYASLGNGSFDFRRNSFETGSLSWSNTKVLQRHILKFGAETRLQRVFNNETNQPDGSFSFGRDMTQGPNATTASQTAGDGFASFLLGLGSGGITKNYKNVATRSRYYAAYIADDWKVTSRLTLNLGLRYEIDTPRTENHDRMTVFDPNISSPLGAMVGLPNLKGGLVFVGENGRSRQQLSADKNNIGPRIGFAYQISKRMVTRGAFGMFYAPSLMQAGGNTGNYGYRADTTYVGSVDGVTPNDYLKNPF
ncbi:MAG: TonB-dependent receptor, partial [Bryobacteraceae bacterium]